MKPLLTTSIFLGIFHALLAAGPPINGSFPFLKSDNGTTDHEESNKNALDYIFLAYDILDVFIDEDVMNLEHDDNNRKRLLALIYRVIVHFLRMYVREDGGRHLLVHVSAQQ